MMIKPFSTTPEYPPMIHSSFHARELKSPLWHGENNMVITKEQLLRDELQNAYYCFVIIGFSIIENYLKQVSIENYFTYLDEVKK